MPIHHSDLTAWRRFPHSHPPGGHAHFWERALSRGVFLKSAAGVGAAALTSDLWQPGLARADSGTVAPQPIPGTILPGLPFHVEILGPIDQGHDPSTITDFNGFVGAAVVDGTGTGTDGQGNQTSLLFDTDMRFMDGVYVGVDGKTHAGTFGFI